LSGQSFFCLVINICCLPCALNTENFSYTVIVVFHLYVSDRTTCLRLCLSVCLSLSLFLSLSLSQRFNGHFSRWTWVNRYQNVSSPCWILLELRLMEVLVTTGGVRYANLHSNCYHQQTNSQIFCTGWMAFLSLSQQYQSTERTASV